MNVSISQASMVRGADGRLYAVTAHGVSEVADTATATARSHIRSGDRDGVQFGDHEAARVMITPGA
ncbi:hypothetical protein [Azospirillum sp. TSO35-2]|uniref:hypothetical protein n=1 Tax=Azospirillum sp. TSO35-2 TaxID=716796 RepID=UPI000D617B3D|nr:hypothetical protein [Azospirillum sp. TSO35-2]PWC37505.1 hypothetical protein TSO352_08125 [Azospirillum sp. TSO35-2]